MIIVAVAAAGIYACIALMSARWLYRTALEGGYEVRDDADVLVATGAVLAIATFWPLVFAYFGLLRLIVRPSNGDTA